MSSREEELEKRLRESEKQFWDRFFAQYDSALKDIRENRESIGKIRTEVKVLALKVAFIASGAIYAVELLIKKFTH